MRLMVSSDSTEDKLPVAELFYSLQGEGIHAGKAAFFIRLSGCDVRCPFCDSKATWSENNNWVSIAEIVASAKKSGCNIAIVTGGEPTMHNLELLTKELRQLNIRTHLETSGTHTLSGKWDWICLSPKQHAPAMFEYYSCANEIKIIIKQTLDFEWAEKEAAQVYNSNGNAELLMQPEWSNRQEILPKMVEYIKKHPKWRLSEQTHKYIGIP